MCSSDLSTAINFYVVFPILVASKSPLRHRLRSVGRIESFKIAEIFLNFAVFTIVCLAIAPIFLEEEPKRKKPLFSVEEDEDEDDYETMILKQRTMPPLHPTSIPGAATKGKKTQ